MAKKRGATNKKQEKRGTNWLVIGGIIGIGVIVLFALLYLAIRTPTTQQTSSLSDFCQENSDNCVTMGSPDAPVTLVEVSDFGCPHCRDFHQEKAPVIKENFIDTNQVKWVFLPYALRPETVPAANAALCAAEDGKYFEFSDALFNQSTDTALTREGFLQAGTEAGVQLDTFATCLDDGRYNAVVSANQQAARSARVTGTPTFFVNDQIVRGNVPLEEFENLFNRMANS